MLPEPDVQARVIHNRVPGRARFDVGAISRRPARASALASALKRLDGVLRASANPWTSSVLIVFDPTRCDQAQLARSIDAALSGGENSEHPVSITPRVASERPGRGEPNVRAPDTRLEQGPALHALNWPALLDLLEVSERGGLTKAFACARLETEGANALSPVPRRSDLQILLDQLKSTPVAMLLASAAFSAATGGVADALAIAAVLGINAGIGYATESGAERTIAALTETPQANVPVRRDGQQDSVPVEAIVRGDLLVLQAGVFVAADARLVEAYDLTVDESSLTGESIPVLKSHGPLIDEYVPLAERVNMVYRGTLITGGSGLALVVATGGHTEIGKIQLLTSSVTARKTPMQEQLDTLGGQLALGAGIACAATVVVGLLRGQALLPMLRTAVSLGVAAVPEGLPTVAMTTLALGLTRMREERVLIRTLGAVETLGAVQVVCLDKTGTLTVNRMTVVALSTGLRAIELRAGEFVDEQGCTVSCADEDLRSLLRIAVLCNEVEFEREHGVNVLRGSPTEVALVQAAIDAGLHIEDVRATSPVLSTQRRSEARNFMSTLHGAEPGPLLAVKGRPSEVLAMCTRYLSEGVERPLGEFEIARIETDNERLAGRALRVLGFAMKVSAEASEQPSDLVWLGLMGMEDPPRDRVAEVMAKFHGAGVRTVMITGDQSATAQAVARQVGLSQNGHIEIIDSTHLDQVAPELLSSLALRADVFSRVSPAHKLQIVHALSSAGLVVAMTGDGVNDSPALKAADIGIAMGGSGTSVAREVADVVLEDDDLHTLVIAIEQGRAIYDDIRKAVHFILATNLSEILYTFTCVASGLGEPLTPMQLLWINLMTDVFPELALAVEPAESDVLARPPRDPARPMFNGADLARLGAEGAIITAGALGAYFWVLRRGGPRRAGSVGFTALTMAQLLHAVSTRSETRSIFDGGRLARNRWLPAALGSTGVLQVAASLVPGLRTLLGTRPLRATDWGVALFAAVAPFLVNETLKVALRPKARSLALPTLTPPPTSLATTPE